MNKSLFLLCAICVGFLIPSMHYLQQLITPGLCIILFFSFLKITTLNGILRPQHLTLIAYNILIPFAIFYFLSPVDSQLALSLFITAFAPTATAAPAVIGFIKRNVSFVIGAVVTTNITVASILPIALGFIGQIQDSVSMWYMAFRSIMIIIIPFLSSQILLHFATEKSVNKWRNSSIPFWTWIAIITIATSNAANFIYSSVSFTFIQLVFVIVGTGIIAITQFVVGFILGGKSLNYELSQSLGQKNTLFMVWFALQFYQPIIALGPIFYLVWHNLYNSYLLWNKNGTVS